MAFGDDLRAARLKAGVTQARLGEHVSMSVPAISLFESGGRSPSLEVAGKMVGYLLGPLVGLDEVTGLNVLEGAGDRQRYEVVGQRGGKPFTIPLEGKRPLGQKAKGNSLWPASTKTDRLAQLADLLDVALGGPPLAVRQIAERVRRGG